MHDCGRYPRLPLGAWFSWLPLLHRKLHPSPRCWWPSLVLRWGSKRRKSPSLPVRSPRYRFETPCAEETPRSRPSRDRLRSCPLRATYRSGPLRSSSAVTLLHPPKVRTIPDKDGEILSCAAEEVVVRVRCVGRSAHENCTSRDVMATHLAHAMASTRAPLRFRGSRVGGTGRRNGRRGAGVCRAGTMEEQAKEFADAERRWEESVRGDGVGRTCRCDEDGGGADATCCRSDKDASSP